LNGYEKLIQAVLIAVIIVELLLAATVLLTSPSKWQNRFFAIFTSTASLWSFGVLLMLFGADYTLVRLGIILFLAAPVVMLFFMCMFAYTFLYNNMPSRRYVMAIAAPALIFTLCTTAFSSNLVTIDQIKPGQNSLSAVREFYVIYAVYFAIYVQYILYLYIINRKKFKGHLRAQIEYSIWAISLTGVVSFTANLFYPIAVNMQWVWVGASSAILYIIVISLAMIKHRFFNIRLVVARSIAYAITLITIAGFYGVVVFSTAAYIFDFNFSFIFQIYVSAATALVALTFRRVKRFFDRISNRLFYQDAYDTQKFLNDLNRCILNHVDVDELLKESAQIIAHNFKNEFTVFCLNESTDSFKRIIGDTDTVQVPAEVFSSKTFAQQLKSRVIIADDLQDTSPSFYELLALSNIAVVARLTPSLEHNPKGIGYFVLGAKKSGNAYSRQDIELIRIITGELIVAVQNALRFEEIANFNATLQQKVDEQTRNLRRTNDKLKAIDESKDEFVSMASHQLRTPLTSIKGYLSMVLEEDAGKITDSQRKMLEQAFISSQRMTFLIADLLNVSRLKTGKFVIDAMPTDLAEVVEQEVSQLVGSAKSRGVTLTYNRPDEFPKVMLDETKIRQVIMNFVDNAIYYTPSGGTIEIAVHDNSKSVELTVTDSGMGIPKEEQHHLFTKFYRATNAKRARPDGTGLGLFMAKKVIIAQGGAIIFRSTEGKGSTFGFSFPKTQPK
jgi:signal transduction histidine kinase